MRLLNLGVHDNRSSGVVGGATLFETTRNIEGMGK